MNIVNLSDNQLSLIFTSFHGVNMGVNIIIAREMLLIWALWIIVMTLFIWVYEDFYTLIFSWNNIFSLKDVVVDSHFEIEM